MAIDNFIFRNEVDMGIGVVSYYRFDAQITEEEIDILRSSLEHYKTLLEQESSCSELVNNRRRSVLRTLDTLIVKFKPKEQK